MKVNIVFIAFTFALIANSVICFNDDYDSYDLNDNSTEYVDDEEDELPKSAEDRAAIALGKLENFMKTTGEKLQKDLLPQALKYVQRLMEADVDPMCLNALMSMGNALQEQKLWAIEMLDAFGKPPSAAMEVTNLDMGSQELCYQAKAENFKTQYCMIGMQGDFPNLPHNATRPDTLANNSLLWTPETKLAWQFHDTYGDLMILGACVPDKCAKKDILNLANPLLSDIGLKLKVKYCQPQDSPFSPTILQLTIICISACIILLVLIATVTDWLKPVEEKYTRASWRHLSLQQSATVLFGLTERKPSPLAFLDGVRVILTFLVVYAHAYVLDGYSNVSRFRRGRMIVDSDDEWPAMFILESYWTVNAFFVLSGAMFVISNVAKKNLNFYTFFTNKLIRLLPVMLVVLGATITSSLLSIAPLWPLIVGVIAKNCTHGSGWWEYLLFINNFWKLDVNRDDYCLAHSWYISSLMQYLIVGFVLLKIYFRSPKIAIAATVLLATGSMAFRFAYSMYNGLFAMSPLALDFKVFELIEKINPSLNLYYWPHARFSVFAVGLALGYMLLKHTRKPIKMSQMMQMMGWTMCIAIYLLITFLPLESHRGNHPTVLHNSLFHAFAYPAQAVMFAWFVFVLATGHLPMLANLLTGNTWHVLSNISLIVYLIHPLMLAMNAGRARERAYWSHYEMIENACWIFTLSSLAAICLQLLLVAPIEYLMALLFVSNKKQVSAKQQVKRATNVIELAQPS